MMGLTARKCVACEGGIPPLSGAALEPYLKEVKGWSLTNGEKMIRKEFAFPDFKSALAFVNKVGDIAESEGHHPDVQLGWGKVVIELSTHAIKGLSENDFILAAKIDAISIF